MRHAALRYHQANTGSTRRGGPPGHQATQVCSRGGVLNPPLSAAAPTGRLRLLLTSFLLLLVAVMAVETIHWPWTNDAQIFHYAVFLMSRGLAPYRQIVDLNLPGSYLSEWVGMHLAPSTDLSYRLYDLLLLALFGWAAVVIARPYNWFAGVLAATLFALLHASEGAWMLGERDFVMAVLLAGAYACTFSATRPKAHPTEKGATALFFGALFLAMACTLKPFALLYAAPLFGLSLRRTARAYAPVLAAFALVAFFALGFLLWRDSLPAFLGSLRLAAGYSSTHRTSFAYMLHHSTPRGLYLLLPPALLLSVLHRSWRIPEVLSLQIATILGLVSYFVQNKGFIYHRYPWVAFALLWLTIECVLALKNTSSFRVPSAALAAVTLAATAFLVAPFYLYRTFHMPPDNSMPTSIVQDLRTLQRSGVALDTHIQCLDGIAGCYSALYRLQLASSTGFMGDQLLFQQTSTPAVERARALFWQQLASNPPNVFVETNYWYGGPQQFTKINTWPAFQAWLLANYTLLQTRTFPAHTGDIDPIGYQIYLRRR